MSSKDKIRESLQTKTTPWLTAVLEEHDSKKWTDEAFEVIEEILEERVSRDIKLGFVLAVSALLGTVPGSILLLYVMRILYPNISECDYPGVFYKILMFYLPAVVVSLSIIAIVMGIPFRRVADKHKTKRNIQVGVALVGLILGLCSVPFWFLVFLCPG